MPTLSTDREAGLYCRAAINDGVEIRLITHALYFIACTYGWDLGVKWRLLDWGVYSPELDALIRLGKYPMPPLDVVKRVKKLIVKLCPKGTRFCWPRIVLAAKVLAAIKAGIDPREVLGFTSLSEISSSTVDVVVEEAKRIQSN